MYISSRMIVIEVATDSEVNCKSGARVMGYAFYVTLEAFTQ